MYFDEEIDPKVLQELYDIICENYGDDYLSDYDEIDYMELLDCVIDFGNDIDGFDKELVREYADALQEKWKEEHSEDEDIDFDDEINECLKNAGVKLNESEDMSEKIDELMSKYERAEQDYEVSDFYDDNRSWIGGRSSAEKRMDEINNELKSLTGKTYKELLNDLGSKDIDKDNGPKLKIGDIYRKNGKLFKVIKVERELYKTRNKENVWYYYNLKEINGPEVTVISDNNIDINNKVN